MASPPWDGTRSGADGNKSDSKRVKSSRILEDQAMGSNATGTAISSYSGCPSPPRHFLTCFNHVNAAKPCVSPFSRPASRIPGALQWPEPLKPKIIKPSQPHFSPNSQQLHFNTLFPLRGRSHVSPCQFHPGSSRYLLRYLQ